MIFTPLRIISWGLGVLVIGLPLAAVILFVLTITGNPGTCESEGRPISGEPAAAGSFQQKWDQLNSTLGAGQTSTIMLTENEVTARARLWAEEEDVPVTNLFICFTSDGAAGSGTIDIPFVPGDVDVLIRGTADLRGEHPEVTIDELEMGGLPGPLSDVLKGQITSMIEDQAEKLTLTHDYGLAFDDGEVTISGQP